MEQSLIRYLTLVSLKNIVSVILAAVIIIMLIGLVMVLSRRDKRRREKNASAGIIKAAGMSTQQSFELNTEELDLGMLCGQPKICALMDLNDRKLLQEYAEGETESELAAKYLVPRSEMESQISELFARLEVNNRAELLKKLQEMYREEQ